MAGIELPGCLLISGMPGAGKSTVSRLVAAQLPRSARVDGDIVNMMVVNGKLRFDDLSEAGRRQSRALSQAMYSLVDAFATAGLVSVVDGVVGDRGKLEEMLELLRARPVMLVTLDPGTPVCRRRNAVRNPDDRVDYDVEPYYQAMVAGVGGVGWWLDNADQTPAETAAQILAEAADRAVLNL